MYTTYHLNANELDEKFLKSIKSLFKGKRIAISVEDEMDETEYLLSTDANRKHLSMALESKEGYAVSLSDLTETTKGKTLEPKKLRKVKI